MTDAAAWINDRSAPPTDARARWTAPEAEQIYNLPFNDLLFQAHTVHRANFDPNAVQMSRLLSIKTGGCAEDCGYCSQSAHYPTGLKASKLMEVERVVAEARKARDGGATRYCMGAAWRAPKDCDIDTILAMVRGVKALGMETCMTLGMLSPEQSAALAEGGLDYYNHNIDTSERFYGEIVTTRTFADRLETLANVREAGMKVCAGGILGLGETAGDRIAMLVTLANLPEPPESVPVNMLIPIPGSKLADAPPVDPIDFVRIIALARILMPRSHVRLSAGRTDMSDEMQALCFFAGANSIFVGETLLTADNPNEDQDGALFRRLGLKPMQPAGAPAMTHGRLTGYEKTLAGLERKDRLRSLMRSQGLDFTSNDYLALADSARLKTAIAAALERGVPAGARGSRLLRGNHEEHEALEAEAAHYFGAERALYFGSGYAANAALFSTLPQRDDLIVHDALIHASAHEGIAASRAHSVDVAHNDVSAFAGAIAQWRAAGGPGRPWIAVESLYSMDGDRAPLGELATLADHHDGFLVIDEAHATGAFGPGGRGLAASLKERDNVLALHTCGKALGLSGALVCAGRVLADYLVNRARAFIYSTAPSPLMAAGVREALRVLADEPGRRQKFEELYTFANRQLADALGVAGSGTQIVPVMIGDNGRAMRVAARMREQGFDIRAIRPPTVPEGTARLRIAITLNIGKQEITEMFASLAAVMAEERL